MTRKGTRYVKEPRLILAVDSDKVDGHSGPANAVIRLNHREADFIQQFSGKALRGLAFRAATRRNDEQPAYAGAW